MKFSKSYFAAAVLIFAIEVLIALFVHDTIVRPYLGDVFVVILIYCFLKSFLRVAVFTVSMIVLLFSFTIEFFQFLNFISILGLEDNKIARTVIGTSFSWVDLLMYALGIVIVLVFEKYVLKKDLMISG